MTYLQRNSKTLVTLILFVFTVGLLFPARSVGSGRKEPLKETSKKVSKEADRKGSAKSSKDKSGNDKSQTRNASDARRHGDGESRLSSKRGSATNSSNDKSKNNSKVVVSELVKRGSKRVPTTTNLGQKPRESELNRPADRKSAVKNNSNLQKRQRAAELAEQKRAEEKRRAEAARQAAIARQRAADEELRDNVQSMIANDDTSGEDAEIRRVALSALGSHAGTVVVMDPRSGHIYSIVNQEWAVREGFKPCSTIKLVTGLAGLNEKVIDPGDTRNISDTNQVDLTKALAYSKNDYFQQVGGQVGFEKMISYARRLGLGEKTGINLPNEFQGRMPLSKSGFALNRMSSHGDDFKVTALQLATLVSAIANGGKLLTPQVTRTRQDETRFKTKVRRSVNIDQDTWQSMIPGMVGAVNYGSAARAHDPSVTIVGKTGTCIEPGGTWVGLFTSFAPLANPRLAVVVIARGPDAQNHFPVAVAGRIYRDLSGRFGTSSIPLVAAARQSYGSSPNSPGKSVRGTYATNNRLETEIALHDDEKEDEAVAVVLPSGRVAVAKSIVRPSLMPIPKRSAKQTDYTAKTAMDSGETYSISTSDGQSRPRRVFSNQR